MRDAHDRPADAMVFTLFADAYPSSPAAGATLCALDAAGARIL